MSKETSSSTNRDSSKSVSVFEGLGAFKTEDAPRPPRVEVPAPPAERRIVLPPSAKFHVVELYNRETEADSSKSEKAEDSEEDSDDDSDTAKEKKKKQAELEAATRPARSMRPPRRVLPSFRPDQLSTDKAEPVEAQLAAPAAHGTEAAPGVQNHESGNMPTIDSFGELPAIEDHDWPDVFIPEQRTESPSMAGESTQRPTEVITFPEQFAEAQAQDDDSKTEVPTLAATMSSAVQASVESAAGTPNAWSPNTNTSTTPPTPPAQPGSGGGGGTTPPTPPFTASHGAGGNTPPPIHPNMYPIASNHSSGFNALPTLATAATGVPVPNMAPRVKARDTLARVMATAAGAGAFFGYKANKNRIKKSEKASEVQYKDIRSQQERLVIDQRGQRMQTENMQQQMHTLRQREMAVASTPDRAEPVRNEQLVPPRTPVQARPIAPRAEMRTASSNKPAEQLPDEQTQAVEPKSARRVETDAWKSYVTENGKLVTDAIEYGQGYRQEQREIISDRTGDSVVAASAASGVAGAAAVAGTTAPGGYMHSGYPQQTVPYQPPMLVSGLTNPGLPTGQLTHADPQHMLPADTPKESTTGPAFWIMLIVIVAAFFAAALI